MLNHKKLRKLSKTIIQGGYENDQARELPVLQAQNQQLQAQLTASQQQNDRLIGAIKYVANSDLLFE